MSHFTVAVVLPKKGFPYTPDALLEKVTELMAPYDENNEWFRDGSRWDWWVIGGRWDGEMLGLEWAPLMEECFTCKGTGIRPGGLEEFGQEWFDNMKGCNGCQGTGKSEAWPSGPHYTSQSRNVCQMKYVSEEFTPYAFVRPTGEWVEQSRMGFWGVEIPDEDGKTKQDKVAGFDQAWAEAREKYKDHVVVSLDAHV